MSNTVVIERSPNGNDLIIKGPFGERIVKEANPVEIGLVIKELLTGEFLAPPVAYANHLNEVDEVDEVDGEGDTND